VPPEEIENVPLKETEIGKVPEDWEVVKLENIFRITSGKTRPKMLKEKTEGPYIFPVFGGNGIIGYSREFLIDYPTIIIGRVGEYCGSVHISQGNSWVSDNALYINQFQQKIDLIYLSNSLKILDLNRLKNTGGQPLISQSIVYSQYIPLPPLPIQQKIASILSAIDAKIEAEENKKKSLEDLFKTLLHNLMTAKIRVDKHRINLKENEL
jgi:type I restriction enzyme S subunit